MTTTVEELRRLANELEQTGRFRAEMSVGPCEDHEGVDCHAAAAFTAWSRAAALVRKRADELASSPLPDSETEWQWGNWLPREERMLKADDEADARRTLAEDGWALWKRQAPGPWIEVTS
ncbi:hypothetical protein [Amycolatopsis sp. NPDC049159]|uniref:hypothetical protein n=1 Tax=Amycolatopsis sp. NPDC049159 TaxID=3157210 RepID=UPI0033CA4D6E